MSHHISLSRFPLFFCFITLIAVLCGGSRSLTYAATFTVDRTDDTVGATTCDDSAPNDCSLRGAVIKANTTPGPDTIILPAGTYTLTIAGAAENGAASGDLDITSDLTINGADAA